MNIEQLFSDLSYGELSSLSLANEGDGTITDAGKERIIRFANEGLLKLYTSFILKQNDVVIELVDWITNYHLLKKFAQSQADTSTQTVLYIKDLWREPFAEDVIRVLEVFTSFGIQLPLDDDDNPHSVFTPQGNVLQVPRPRNGMALSIMYQAKHPVLTLDNPSQEIELPDVLVPALRAWIAARTFGQMNTQESLGTSGVHETSFKNICTEVIQQDLVSTSISTTGKRFEKNGWI